MSDGPDKIDFEQRRTWGNHYESIPRRRNDKRMFDILTQRQQDAYNFIEEAHAYEMAGLPAARMKYTDAPGGYDYELTPQQLQKVLDYQDWLKLMLDSPNSKTAIFAYMAGSTLRDIETALRIRNGTASVLVFDGLNVYCIMKKWGDQSLPVPHNRKLSGIRAPAEITFIANEISSLGQPVRDMTIPLDDRVLCPTPSLLSLASQRYGPDIRNAIGRPVTYEIQEI